MRRFVPISLILVSPLLAGTIMPTLQQKLEAAQPGERVAVLVHLKEKPEFRINKTTSEKAAYIAYLKDFAATTQRPVIDFARSIGVEGIKSYWIFNGFYAEATPDQIKQLANRSDVEYIIDDFVVTLPKDEMATPADRTKAVAWGVAKIQADSVWINLGFTGAGIVVSNMDTGVDASHPALAGKIRATNGWYDAVNGQSTPYDDHGHGTHTMGTICGGDGTGSFTEDIGVAPGATFVAVKIFNSSGSSSSSIIHDGFQWIANLASTGEEPDLVSNSWGSTATTSTEYWSDVATWRSLGIRPIFSIGNSGPGSATAGTPGNYPLVIGVGATDSNDDIASFSSRGPAPNQSPWNDPSNWLRSDWNLIKPDISAPGVNVRSSLPGGGYGTMDGTSMACPHVAGVVALMLEKNPTLDMETIYDVILNTADQPAAGGSYPNNNYGWGRVNAYQAVMNTPSANTPNVVVYHTDLNEPSGNGLWDPNEAVSFTVTLRNTGVDVNNVQATLSGSDAYVSLTDSQASYGNIPSGDTAVNTADPYDAFANSSTPCGYDISFDMHITGDGGYETDRSVGFTIGTSPGQVFNTFDAQDTGTYAIAFDGNNLWESFYYTSTIYKVDPDDGSLRSSFSAPSDGITGLSWDPTRNALWVHCNANNTIYLMDTLGNVVNSFSSPATGYPTGITFDPNQDILYVVDRDNALIYTVDPSSGSTINSYSVNFGGYYGPRGLAIEPRGNSNSGTLLLIYTYFNSSGGLDSTVLFELNKNDCSRTGNSYNFGAINLRGVEFDSRNNLYWISNFQDNTVQEIGGFYCEGGSEIASGFKPVLPLAVSGPMPSVSTGSYSLLITLPSDEMVSIKVYDPAGRLAERVFAGKMAAGFNTVNVQSSLGHGVYFVKITAGSKSITKKLVIH